MNVGFDMDDIGAVHHAGRHRGHLDAHKIVGDDFHVMFVDRPANIEFAGACRSGPGASRERGQDCGLCSEAHLLSYSAATREPIATGGLPCGFVWPKRRIAPKIAASVTA
jgi:hypothetical protein